MRVDLRVKHDIEARKAAIGLFELGHGYKSAAIALSLPAEAVRRWQEIYRAFGSEVLLRMDGKLGRYTYEQKTASGRRDLLAHRQRLRAPDDSDVPQGGRGGRDSRQDRARDDTRDVDSLRYQARDGLPQVQLVQGRRRRDVRERDREGFRRRGPVAEAGNIRTGAGSTSAPRTHPGSRPPASSRACPGRRTASTTPPPSSSSATSRTSSTWAANGRRSRISNATWRNI